MAAHGVTTVLTDTPSLKVVTWVVSSAAAAQDTSDLINFSGYEVVEWYISAVTGYTSGNFTIAMAMASDGSGLIAQSAGRSIRAIKSSTSVNESGYLICPPPSGFLTVTVLGTTPTAFTITLYARPSNMVVRRSGL